jgi:hypothetical protein
LVFIFENTYTLIKSSLSLAFRTRRKEEEVTMKVSSCRVYPQRHVSASEPPSLFVFATQQQKKELEECTTCSICFCPVSQCVFLPCQHFFCQKCIFEHCKTIINKMKKEIPRCPICREMIPPDSILRIVETANRRRYCSPAMTRIVRIQEGIHVFSPTLLQRTNSERRERESFSTSLRKRSNSSEI